MNTFSNRRKGYIGPLRKSHILRLTSCSKHGGKIYVLSNAVAARIQSLSQRFRYIQKAVHQALSGNEDKRRGKNLNYLYFFFLVAASAHVYYFYFCIVTVFSIFILLQCCPWRRLVMSRRNIWHLKLPFSAIILFLCLISTFLWNI